MLCNSQALTCLKTHQMCHKNGAHVESRARSTKTQHVIRYGEHDRVVQMKFSPCTTSSTWDSIHDPHVSLRRFMHMVWRSNVRVSMVSEHSTHGVFECVAWWPGFLDRSIFSSIFIIFFLWGFQIEGRSYTHDISWLKMLKGSRKKVAVETKHHLRSWQT